MGAEIPQNNDERSFQATAFHLALAEVSNSDIGVEARLKDCIVDAIVALANAGQRDPEALARYAVSKCHQLR